MRDYISKASDLLDEIWSDKEINIVKKSYSLGKRNFDLFDISLSGQGTEEDKKYVRSGFYRKNIRRGNTIIEDCKTKYCQFARKGLPKMLDIRLEHVQYFAKQTKLDKQERNIAEIIFQGVNIAFDTGNKLELVVSEKLNGENAQVSYNFQFDAWVVCSKNVSILAASRDDLEMYKDGRYNYARLIADQWFKEINKLAKQEIKSLKKLLDGYTAVGQYCGHPDQQHLIQYEQIGIRWLAIVDNFSDEYCLDPLKTKKQFQKFGFKVAKTKSIILTSSPDKFYTQLEKLFLKVAQAGIEDIQFGMEGSIVYFVVSEKDKKQVKPITVGGGKLKTLEYRFLRKIREKVSKAISKKQPLAQTLSKYKVEIEQLKTSSSSRAPYPDEYYIKILSACLQLVEITGLSEEKLRRNFISVLKIVFYALYKRVSIKKHGQTMLNDKLFIQKVREIPFEKYNGLGCNTKIVYVVLGLPGMFKSYLAQKFASHFQRISVPYMIIQYEQKNPIDKQLQELLKPQTSSLEHFYLDGALDSQLLFNLVKCIKNNGNQSSYYKIILIKDQAKQNFMCANRNQYPFSLETIVMSYYGQHQRKVNSARLQEKMDNLKVVTQKLMQNANFNEITAKLKLEQCYYPFSSKCKLSNIEEFRKIICDILKVQDEKLQFNYYASLILRLEKIEDLEYLNEDEISNEVEHLIKASYPSIPLISFKK